MRRYVSAAAVATLALACAQPVSTAFNPPRGQSSATGVRAYTPSSPRSRELSPEQQVQHVLNRLAFGPRPGDAAKVREMGVDRWIDLQLHPERIDDRAGAAVVARYPALAARTADIVAADRERQQLQRQQQQAMAAAGDTANRQAIRLAGARQSMDLALPQQANQQMMSAKVARAVESERQLQEVMVEFWANHFSVFQGKGQVRLYLPEYDRDVIRPRVMGNFRDLLGAVAHSSAMLFYLDNAQSQADSMHPTLAQLRSGRLAMAGRGGRGAAAGRGVLPPAVMAGRRRGLNENYARELMELHTLGVDGGYTQTDVVEVARALTGWSIAQAQGGGFIFRPETHDAAEKKVLGHTLPRGRGIEDGEQVLDILAKHPSTARHITTKLARRFISDDPPESVVDRCSDVFTKTDGDIRQTLGCVVTSEEFFSKESYRAKVKTPFEVVVSAVRALSATTDATPRITQQMALLGQPVFGRQTPDGWPDTANEWMNTGAILNRINFGLSLAGGRVAGVTLTNLPELEALRNAPRERQVDGVIALFFGGDVSKETRDILLTGANPLLGGGVDSTSMSNDMGGAAGRGGRGRGARGALGGGRPPVPPPVLGGVAGRGGRAGGPAQNRVVELQGLAQVVGLALGAPEFQRR